MKDIKFEKVPAGIFDKVKSNKEEFVEKFIDDLDDLFPETVKDGKVDFQALIERFGEYEERDERYELTWMGKSKARQESFEDIVGRTLKYVKEDSKNPETTENLYIEGDNLEVLKLLRKSYYGKIKMIYLDPPYNTGSDFVFKDNFALSKEEYDKLKGDVDEYGNRLVKNNADSGRYHSNWLNMMYPRLQVAKDLLTDDGVIFISIDDKESHNIRKICDEIFGDKNFIGSITRNTNSSKNQALFLSISHDYCLVYSKNQMVLTEKHSNNKWEVPKNNVDEYVKKVEELKKIGLSHEEMTEELKTLTKYPRFIDFENYWYFDKKGLYRKGDLGGVKNGNKTSIINPLTNREDPIPPGGFRFNENTLNKLIEEERIHFHTDGSLPTIKRYLDENLKQRPKGIMSDDQRPDDKLMKEFNTPFDNPKQLTFMKRIISIVDKDSIILDFFSGSSTTAHAVIELNAEDRGNRKYIMVQLPEPTDERSEAYNAGYKNIVEIGKRRIRQAGEKVMSELQEKYDKAIDEEKELIKSPDKLDIGFKVLRVENTNFRRIREIQSTDTDIEYRIGSVKDQEDFNPHFTDIDVVYELMLRRQDIELTEEIKSLDNIGDRTYIVGDTMLVCLEEKITKEMVEQIGSLDMDLSWIVLRDSAFDDDCDLKINTARKLRSIIKANSGKEQKIYWI